MRERERGREGGREEGRVYNEKERESPRTAGREGGRERPFASPHRRHSSVSIFLTVNVYAVTATDGWMGGLIDG